MPTVRTPLVGSYNSRFFSPSDLGTSSGIVGVGVVGVMIVGASTEIPYKDQRFVNCFPIVVNNAITGKQSVKLVKRPGFAPSSTVQNGSIGNALMVWSGQGTGTKLISSFGATTSSIYDGTTRLTTDHTDTTIISGRTTGITETSLSGTATVVISASNNTAWWYQNSGTVTRITDADFPGNAGKTLAGTFSHIDGYAVILTTSGDLYNSDLNSVTSWGSINYLPMSSYPDLGVCSIRWSDYIMCFGTESIQFVKNTGNAAGSPFSRVEGMTVRMGIVNADSVAQINDVVFWISTGPNGSVSVHAWDGKLRRISTPEIDAQLLLVGASNLSMTTCKFNGRSFVICSTNTRSFVYCVDSEAWHEWSSGDVLWYKCVGVSAGADFVTYAISKTATSGKTYVLNPASYSFNDDGRVYSAYARTNNIDLGTNNRKSWQKIDVICDHPTDESLLAVSWSDDDYQTYATERVLDLSDQRNVLYRLGNSRRRAFVFEHTSDTAMSIEALEITYDVGST
jgi:hypothetical protein